MPSSENRTAGGEYRSFTPQSSAPSKSSFSSSPPNLKWPPSHLDERKVCIPLAAMTLEEVVMRVLTFYRWTFLLTPDGILATQPSVRALVAAHSSIAPVLEWWAIGSDRKFGRSCSATAWNPRWRCTLRKHERNMSHGEFSGQGFDLLFKQWFSKPHCEHRFGAASPHWQPPLTQHAQLKASKIGFDQLISATKYRSGTNHAYDGYASGFYPLRARAHYLLLGDFSTNMHSQPTSSSTSLLDLKHRSFEKKTWRITVPG